MNWLTWMTLMIIAKRNNTVNVPCERHCRCDGCVKELKQYKRVLKRQSKPRYTLEPFKTNEELEQERIEKEINEFNQFIVNHNLDEIKEWKYVWEDTDDGAKQFEKVVYINGDEIKRETGLGVIW